jgi:endonuclease YncB( thermonuclease family)
MTRRGAPSLVLSSLLLLLLALFPPLPALAIDTATIVRIVDGDTVEIKLQSQTEKVRLIGVDTPEKYESDKLGSIS